MKRNLILTLSLMTVLIVSGGATLQQNVGDLFQQAVHQEEVKGDLQAAIPLYQRVERESSDRSLAARAQLRIGLCYEKLGKDEARKAYERLVRDYADQPEQVKLARTRLAALGKTADDNKELAFANRKVWAVPYRFGRIGPPSPDGRYLSFVDYATGGLAIRDLETGTNRPLTNEDSQEEWGFVMYSRWSPDGKQIAYDWVNNAGCIELRIVTREGGKPRTLIDCEDDEGQWFQAHDWSPDGKHILISYFHKGLSQIVLVSAADGTTRVLKTLKSIPGSWVYPHTICFSRDGRYIAYNWPRDDNSHEQDIFLISADGGDEVPLVKHPAHDFLLGWLPNREGILFGSDRTGSFDLWFLPVSAGKVQGGPELVKRSIGQIEPIGFTKSGSYYYTQGMMREKSDVYVVRMDPQSGKIVALPETLAKRFEGYNFQPEYSRDGKYLAYTTRRNRTLSSETNNPNVLCILSLETGKEREFSTKFYNIACPQWSPNGQFIYFGATLDRQGRGGLYQMNTQNGEITPVSEAPQGFPAGFTMVDWQFTPDGKSMIWEMQAKPNEPFHILIRDPWIQEDKQIYTGNLTMFSISPDGKWLALKFNEDKQKVVQVMPISGGQPKELLRYKEDDYWNYVGQIEWTADGKYILFQKLHYIKDQPHYALWRIAAEGGEPQELNLVMASFQDLSAHPNGQHLAFSSIGFTRKNPAVWVMENILP